MIGLLIGAWLDVRAKPLRTVAAIAGMVAAVVAVVLVDAAGVLSRDASDDYLARSYGRAYTFAIMSEDGRATAEHGERMEEVLARNGIDLRSPDVTASVRVVRDASLVPDSVGLVSSAWPGIRIVDMVHGAWPADTAASDVLHVVVTERKAQELGFTGPDAVGQPILYATDLDPDLRTTPLGTMVIDGVAASTSNAFGYSGILAVSDLPRPELMPAHASPSWLVRVNPADGALLQELVGSVTDAGGSPVFQARRADSSQELAPVLAQQEVTAGAVTAVALTIGGLGIFGVGLASVRERARDFGLRRALGASKGRIFAGVIVQTLLEAVLAAAVAIFLAAILLELFARDLVLSTLPLPASTTLPVSSAAQGLIGAVLVGLVAGLLPALSAARASVAQALRA